MKIYASNWSISQLLSVAAVIRNFYVSNSYRHCYASRTPWRGWGERRVRQLPWQYCIINLKHWLIFIHKIQFSKCFEPQALIFRGIQMYTCNIWYCHSTRVPGGLRDTAWEFSLKLYTDRPPGTLMESESAICCMYTTVSSWRWAPEARNMYRRLRLETCREEWYFMNK